MRTTPLSLSRRLARSLTALSEPVSDSETDFIQRHVRDTLAIAVAALATPLGAAAVRGATFGTDGGASRIIGQAGGFPPATAAFANSALAHILDFDDIHDPARLHPTTVTFPAALAAAQASAAQNGGADGMSVLRGVLMGSELMCRLGTAANPIGSGRVAHWFLTQLLGALGAAVAAGTALRLDEDGLVEAIGLAAMQAAGSKQVASAAATGRAIYPAFAASAGVNAALLAAQGFTAAPDALEGRDGLLSAYLGQDQVADAVIDSGRWAYLDTAIKPWPCCRISHPYVSAALRARRMLAEPSRSLDPGQVSEVVIEVNASAAKLCHPLDRRRAPETAQDAKYSIPFMTAHALWHGTVSLDSTTGAFFADDDVRRLAAAVSVRETLPDGPGHAPARIRVTTADGRTAQSRADAAELDADGTKADAKTVACFEAAADPACSADPAYSAEQLAGAVARLPGLRSGLASAFDCLSRERSRQN